MGVDAEEKSDTLPAETLPLWGKLLRGEGTLVKFPPWAIPVKHIVNRSVIAVECMEVFVPRKWHALPTLVLLNTV